MMKKLLFLILITTGIVSAQFKDKPLEPEDVKSGITNYSPSSTFLSFFNPDNFDMKHTVSMSYATGGGHGYALGVYTNSMSYKFTDNLKVEVDASMVNSPYSSFGDNFANSVNGIYLSRARVHYKPTEKSNVVIEYRGGPAGYYNSPYRYNDFGRGGYYGRSSFNEDFYFED